MEYEYLDYHELDDSEVAEESGGEEEEKEERVHEMLRTLCSIIKEVVQELNDLLENLLKEQ